MTQARASAFGELDIWLARAGRHEQLYSKLGAHVVDGGVRFAVWAPNAQYVSVIGDFNDWDSAAHVLEPVAETRHLGGHRRGRRRRRALQVPPRRHARRPTRWRSRRSCRRRPLPSSSSRATSGTTTRGWTSGARQEQLERPMSVYEVHAPSWRKGLGWRQLADELAPYVRDLGFTHVELLPVMHHPYSGSWGYQVTGFYAPVSTMGSPDDFRYFVDHMHANGIGVLLDWVPAHFATDPWALTRFDGTALYEHDDPRRGEHPDWGTLRLQPRPQRGAELPARERALLAARVPRRRHPRRRRRVDALPRLLAQGRRVGAERVRRPRGPRCGRVPQGAERARARARAGRDLGRRGVDRLAGRLAADLRRRARLRLQVEHGVDARHAELLPARSRLPPATTITS